MVLHNTWNFVDHLGGQKPLFHIDVLLMNSDVVLYPTTPDLYKWMTSTLRGCTERSAVISVHLLLIVANIFIVVKKNYLIL